MLNVGVEPVLVAKNTHVTMVVDIVKTKSKYMISNYREKARNLGVYSTLALMPRPSDKSNLLLFYDCLN